MKEVGGMALGLFKSERTHTLTLEKDGQTSFKTEETFSGLLLPIFGKNLPVLTENFQAFVEGLKRQAKKTDKQSLTFHELSGAALEEKDCPFYFSGNDRNKGNPHDFGQKNVREYNLLLHRISTESIHAGDGLRRNLVH